MMRNKIADYMKSFVNPLRLEIIETLQENELSVSQIVERTGAKQCYVSQQLIYLSRKGILDRRKKDNYVYYSLRNRAIINMLNLVQISFESEMVGSA